MFGDSVWSGKKYKQIKIKIKKKNNSRNNKKIIVIIIIIIITTRIIALIVIIIIIIIIIIITVVMIVIMTKYTYVTSGILRDHICYCYYFRNYFKFK